MTILMALLLSMWQDDTPIKPPKVSEAFAKHFEACEYRYTGGQYHDELFRYRMFVPRHLNPTRRYPLLVWLHGVGENGSDNVKNLTWLDLILCDTDHLEQYPFFLLVVQCPKGGRWSTPSDPASDMLSVAYAILQENLKNRPIDLNRVYLSGVSAGGTACWDMALRYPETFAAMVPISSEGVGEAQAERLVPLPIWAFHNAHDKGTPPDSVKRTVAALQQAGSNQIHLTLNRSFGHDAWKTAFGVYNVMDWMLDQRRGAWICWTPPGHRAWRWWHVLGVPLAFVTLLGIGWYSERRRRQRLKAGDVVR